MSKYKKKKKNLPTQRSKKISTLYEAFFSVSIPIFNANIEKCVHLPQYNCLESSCLAITERKTLRRNICHFVFAISHQRSSVI